MINLSGKTAIVTGASRGIGLAAARELAQCGANVVLASRSDGDIKRHSEELQQEGRQAHAVQCDVTRYEDVSALVEETRRVFGKVDILVNNAGVIDPIERLSEADPELWATAVDTNLKGVFFCMRAVLPLMESNREGVIVNISSGAANSVLEGWSHYCSTKAAAKKLTECAHLETADKGVRVVGLSPGTVATDMMTKIKRSGVNPVSQLDWDDHIPPEWAGKAVVFLCGPEGEEFAGSDFSLKTEEGRRRVGLV